MKTMSVIQSKGGLIPKSDKMRYGGVFLFLACTVLALSATGLAFEIETDSDWQVRINGYADVQYTYMSTMPMFMNMNMGGGMFSNMSVSHELSQEHFNLLFDAERGRFRTHLNFEALRSLTTVQEDWERQHLLQAYGEYTFDDSLRLRFGKSLAPFGIYNDVRYITPLYASVVLPFMYQTPGNYSGTPLTPPPAVAMVSGDFWGEDSSLYYAFYLGMEDKTEQHVNTRDVGSSFGGRLRLTVSEKLSLGFSAFTVKDQVTRSIKRVTVMGNTSLRRFRVESLREFTWGADMQYEFPGKLTLEGEIAHSDFQSIGNRMSYYVRLKKEIGRWTPFIAYDVYRDDADPIYRARGNRYGVGASYRINDNTYLKAEYHFHDFANDRELGTAGSAQVSDTSQMVRISLIYAF